MAYCLEGLVEWSMRWEEVKKTVFRVLVLCDCIIYSIFLDLSLSCVVVPDQLSIIYQIN